MSTGRDKEGPVASLDQIVFQQLGRTKEADELRESADGLARYLEKFKEKEHIKPILAALNNISISPVENMGAAIEELGKALNKLNEVPLLHGFPGIPEFRQYVITSALVVNKAAAFTEKAIQLKEKNKVSEDESFTETAIQLKEKNKAPEDGSFSKFCKRCAAAVGVLALSVAGAAITLTVGAVGGVLGVVAAPSADTFRDAAANIVGGSAIGFMIAKHCLGPTIEKLFNYAASGKYELLSINKEEKNIELGAGPRPQVR